MSSVIQFFMFFSLIYLAGANAQARSSEESFHLLREAMMDSNADYNKHKKKMNHEEFDRADEWSERDTQAININGRTHSTVDHEEFKQLKDDFRPSEREVSSHIKEDESKAQD